MDTNLVVLDGEEHEATRGCLEQRLVLLLEVDVAEDSLVAREQCAEQPVVRRLTVRREHDQAAPPVGGVGAPRDEAAALELSRRLACVRPTAAFTGLGYEDVAAELRARLLLQVGAAAAHVVDWRRRTGREVPADLVAQLSPTEFLGYDELQAGGLQVVALLRDGRPVDAIEAGDEAVVFLDRTPFYAESGGQVGDTGELDEQGVRFVVTDTQKYAGQYHGHSGRLTVGTLRKGDHLLGSVDAQRRATIVLNHSATHLLHGALRERLGEGLAGLRLTALEERAAEHLGLGLHDRVIGDLTAPAAEHPDRERLVAALDATPTRVNSLTSNFLTRARVPLSLPTDRDVIAACLDTCWRIDRSEARVVVIPNTLELTALWVTRPLAAEVEADGSLAFETEFLAWPIDTAGSLDQETLFPESLRARRREAVHA